MAAVLQTAFWISFSFMEIVLYLSFLIGTCFQESNPQYASIGLNIRLESKLQI